MKYWTEDEVALVQDGLCPHQTGYGSPPGGGVQPGGLVYCEKKSGDDWPMCDEHAWQVSGGALTELEQMDWSE